MPSQVIFYDWAPSPFCFKVRAVLDYKGIAYKRVNALGRNVLKIRREGKVGKVPAIEIDGEMLTDSTDIVYALEQRFSGPQVIPASTYDRARCHALEDWADESLYFIGLYYQWIEPEGRKMVPLAFGKSLFGRLAFLYYSRLITRQLAGQGTLRKPAEHVHRDLIRHIESISALLQPQPFLLGDKPYLCDFALLGQLVYLARTPVGGQLLAGNAVIDGFRMRMKELNATAQQGSAGASR